MQRIIVIAEDYERTLKLLRELDERGAVTELWNVTTGALMPTTAPPNDAIFFCRQSPSCASRGHKHSIAYVRNLLWWLEHNNCQVINGLRAFELEMSKASQMALLHSRGINTPRTRLVVGAKQLWIELVNSVDSHPVLIKPDTGGSGMGIQAFPNASQAAMHIRSDASFQDASDLWIIQEHVNAYTDDESQIRSILRFEIVDGKVLYVMQIRAPATEFKLCPCDPKMEAILSKIEFRIITNPLTIPCFRAHPEAYASFVGKLERIWMEVGARVGSAEAFMPVSFADDADRREYSPETTIHPLEPVVFEMNFNSNYNQKAEGLVGISGAGKVADMLCRLATRPSVVILDGEPPKEIPILGDSPAPIILDL